MFTKAQVALLAAALINDDGYASDVRSDADSLLRWLNENDETEGNSA
jgi:hypothetical protein